MLLQVTGDILLTKAQVIVHGVAPNDDFHQGLALSLREQWPALYKDFRHYCKTTHIKRVLLQCLREGPETLGLDHPSFRDDLVGLRVARSLP